MKCNCAVGEGEIRISKQLQKRRQKRVLMLASVASMIDQFNMSNIYLLQEMGYEVHVACNFVSGNTCDADRVMKFQHMLERMQVHWYQWDCPRKIEDVKCFYTAYSQLLELTAACAFTWIHCQSPAGGALARLVAHKRQIHVIYTAHGFHFYQGAPLKNWILYYPLEKLLAYCTDVLITINREDFSLAKRTMKAGRIYYLPGVGVDFRRFYKTDCLSQEQEKDSFRKKYQIPGQAAILLSVGELSQRKNHRIVIEALARLKRKDVYYFICGQGEQKQPLMYLAEKLGVADQIRLTGYQEEIDVYYRNADLFVFPSIQEGLPVALMEAMAAGLACVVSDIRGNKELIDRAGGIRFHPKRPGQLTQALQLLLSDNERIRVCAQHNQNKARQFDQSFIRRRMMKIYKTMEGI